MPTFQHGTASKLLMDGYELSDWFQDSTIGGDLDMADTTTYTATVKTYIGGEQDGRLEASGLYDPVTANNGPDQVFPGRVGQLADVMFSFSWGFAQGKPVKMFASKLANYEVVSSVSEAVRVNVSAQGGGPYPGTSLAQLTSRGASGNANGENVGGVGTPTTFGGIGQYHCTTNTRNGNITLKIQHSDTQGGTYGDLITFANIPGSTVKAEQQSVTGTVQPWIRLLWTFAGTTGSATFTAAFWRRMFA